MSSFSTGSLDDRNLSRLFKNFSDPKFGKNEPSSYQVVSGSGEAWYYAPKTRSEIITLPLEVDDQERMHVIDASGRYFLVPIDEILDVGLN